MAAPIYIGIDGGGTHSTAVAAWPDGQIAAVVSGGGLNYHNDGVPAVRARLEDMVSRLQSACSNAEVIEVCAGLSALDAPAEDAVLSAFSGGLLKKEQLDFQQDAYAALMGLTQGEAGVIVICGTGSMLLMADKKGNQIVSGGWGYLLSDAGSGFTLAREALLAVIAHEDGTGPATALTGDALAFFSADTPRRIIDRVYAPDFSPDQLAGFARQVIARADEGEKAALGILDRNMKRLASLACRLTDKAPDVRLVGLYGGIFQHSELARRLFSEAVSAEKADIRIVLPEYPPELGALIHLMKKHGILTDAVLKNMKESYEEIRHEHA